MKKIITVSSGLEQKAKAVSVFRSKTKDYLARFGACYDKFTITENDTFLGFVSETAITNYLVERYGEKIDVKHWADSFDMKRIINAVNTNNGSPKEVNYVKEYFYDAYDLEIIEKKSRKSILVDVKTAETSKQPQPTWDFLYPVVQNERRGKDCVVLCYYCKTNQFNDIILVGYIREDEISNKPILAAGTRTKFGTINQIDNYETKIADYNELSQMFNTYFGWC